MRLEQIYQDVILDHYKHPQHRGLREPFGAQVHHVNPICGDEVTLRVALSDDGEHIVDVSYDGDVLGDGVAFAGVAKYPARVKCALLGWMAFKDALAQATDDIEEVKG